MAPLTTGIEQPFDSSVGIKRLTKIQGSLVPAPPVFPSLTQSECMSTWELALISGAAVGLYGAYVQLYASTVRANIWASVEIRGDAGFNTEASFDLATGAAASEVTFWDNVTFRWQGPVAGGNSPVSFYYGGAVIPSGSRVSVRIKDDLITAETYYCLVQLWAL